MNYTYRVYFDSDSNAPGQLSFDSYTVTDTLPANATYVSSTRGGQYDASTNTVTWTDSARRSGGYDGIIVGEVTVQYKSPAFADGQTVTNNVSHSGIPIGETPPMTGSASVANVLIDNTTFGVELSKTFAGEKTNAAPVGANAGWSITARNTGKLMTSTTITDYMACIDDGSGKYVSQTDAQPVCQQYSAPSGDYNWTDLLVVETQLTSDVVKLLHWTTNKGNTGTCRPEAQ